MSTAIGMASLPLASEDKNRKAEIPGLVLAAQEVLLQGLELLQMSGQQYAQVVGTPFNASIGQHYRHVLEHFQSLVKGAASGEVDYDSRQRDQQIETDKDFATNTTRELVQELNVWTDETLERRCTAISSVAYEKDLPSCLSSNLARELAYCIGHTIHHYAIIRLACGLAGVIVPVRFGYAPSTIKYQKSLAAH